MIRSVVNGLPFKITVQFSSQIYASIEEANKTDCITAATHRFVFLRSTPPF